MASCTPAFIPTISRACNRTLRRQRSPLPSLCPAHHARVSLVTVSPSSFRSQHAFNRAERGVFMVTESESPNAPSSGESEYLSDFRPEPPMSDLTTSRGFALEEAKTHTFEAFNLDQSAFQTGGAYAISDASDTVMYMGYTKNIATKLSFHQRLQPQSCKTFRVYVPPVPPELMSPEMLESVLEYWVRENGSVPRGNTIDRALWEQEKPIDRQVLLGAIFVLFLLSSIIKQVLFFTTRY